MKRIAFIATLLFVVVLFLFRSHLLTLLRPAPRVYPTTVAMKEVGRYETIVGRVAEVSESGRGTVFIDFGASYPRQSFTAMIPAGDVSRFAGLLYFKGRTVGVTGRVDLYRGKPEIIVRHPDQLKLGG